MSSRPVHPIEEQSYRIMRSRVDFSHWAPGARDLVERMVHASADESFVTSTLVGERCIDALVEALRSGSSVICDSRMVAAGVPSVATRVPVACYLDQVAGEGGGTRAARAIELAAVHHRDGAIWVIGNAPTALARLLELHQANELCPGAVIGLPVGYVGAAEAKADLWASPLRAISVTNVGSRGGSPVAAAALNAAARLAWP